MDIDAAPPVAGDIGGRIVQLEVQNFKSYGGRQTIGPFAGFTAVVGPNGSGKSNLMDAASFVLGVRARQLRGALRDLVHTGASRDDGAPPTRARVELLFRPADGSPDVRFARVLDGRTVTWDAYDAKLRSFGVLVRARNFLVFQGDIEAVASMSPAGLTDMFEHVSGSGALRAEYEAAERAKAAAEEAASVALTKKRTTAVERRQKRDQKEEAEKYLRTRAELDEVKGTAALLKLFHADRAAAAARDAAAAARARLADAEAAAAEAEEAVATAAREAGAATKERMKVEAAVVKARDELEARNPAAVRAREEAARVDRRRKEAAAAVAAAAARVKEHGETLARLRGQLAQLQDAERAADARAREAAADGAAALDEAAREEYARIDEAVKIKTGALRADAQRLEGARASDEAALAAAEAALATIDGQRAAHAAAADDAAAAREAAAAAAAAAREDLKAARADAARAADDARRAAARREEAAARLAVVDDALRDARAERRETERERRIADAVAHMARVMPGVKGRVTDLATAAQRRHHLALAVVLGKDMDSVVVDTEATAKACIQYLKEARLPPLTFIPVETVRAKPVNERLRSLGGTARLALDLLTFDAAVERAVRAVCGDTLVCDTVDEARSVAFMGAERHKVVALDGTLITRAGLITGGLTRSMESRAARFDEGEVAKLKDERAGLAETLASLPDARSAAAAVDALKARVAGLEHDAALKAADADRCGARADAERAKADALAAEAARKARDVPALRAARDAHARDLAAVTARVHEVGDRLFAPLSRRLGVPNVRETMEAAAAAAGAARAAHARCAAQIAKLTHQVAYEEKQAPAAALAAARADAAAADARATELAAAVAAAAEGGRDAEAALERERGRAAALREREAAAGASLKAARRAASAAAGAVTDVRAAIVAADADADAAAGVVAGVVEAAALDEVALPRADGADGGAFDFSSLPRHLTAPMSAADRASVAESLAAQAARLTADLAAGAPNLKAVAQYDDVKARERALAADLDAARAAARDAADAFARVRGRRHALFMAAFDAAAAAVNDVFKDLTRSDAHPAGGSAHLSLDNADDPYLGGVKFTAMPPAKRYRDMDALSGGEKTLSALALLFAVHAFRAAPFFVLDEVDAALDAANVARVAAYVRARTRGDGVAGPPLQAVVISLKDGFYHHADALVGVTRDPASGSSHTLTFDLERYGPPTATA